jgi:hypothetical protein
LADSEVERLEVVCNLLRFLCRIVEGFGSSLLDLGYHLLHFRTEAGDHILGAIAIRNRTIIPYPKLVICPVQLLRDVEELVFKLLPLLAVFAGY